MAKQISDTIISANIDNLVFYKMEGKGYVRRASSLTGKRFKTDKRFANSRKSADRFGKANAIASELYCKLSLPERKYAVFCALKIKAIALLKQGKSTEEVKLLLHS